MNSSRDPARGYGINFTKAVVLCCDKFCVHSSVIVLLTSRENISPFFFLNLKLELKSCAFSSIYICESCIFIAYSQTFLIIFLLKVDY